MNSIHRKTILEVGILLKTQQNFVIFGHVNPDGDAIGSTLALYHYLKSKEYNVFVIMPNDFPDFLKFLPLSSDIIIYEKQKKEAEKIIKETSLSFYCDFNEPKRLGNLSELEIKLDSIKVLIDHHPQPSKFVDYSISDTSVSSTSELIYEFISQVENSATVLKEIAECLMAGIITDTGLFHHNSSNPRTFEIIANLIKSGADKDLIINQIYNTYSYDRMKLLGSSLFNWMRVLPEYGSAYIYLSKEVLKKYKYQIGDTEGLVNYPLSISGINFSALFVEHDDYVKVSLRSKNSFDTNLFAREHYKGGGHINASGGKSFVSLSETTKLFTKLLSKYKSEIIEQ
ncbi:MAG: bifunctional oligoribonuclease/PAP phosphatase NrnA [Bacteroidales bacterium]|nr:bifunctional oligoribonuclease/PAP phosphatase NrnA [Bacteroidales bacterium]MBN2756250.1 bifunctional oligoribonuclease/PAP phosphatase NrnA [Bacteroidales bacterium]